MTTARTSTPTDDALATASRVPHRWRNLLTLTGISVVDNTENSVVSTIFPAIAAALHLTSASLGLLAALGKIASVPTGPAWVWLSSRIGRRATLVTTTLAGGVFGILAGFSHNFGTLLLFNTLMAAAVIGGIPIANAVIADSFENSERGKAAGIFYGAINTVAAVIGPVIAQFTGLTNGWRYAMWTIGAVCLLAGLVVAVGFRDPGIGSAERQLADLNEADRVTIRVSFASVLSVFRVPSYSVMMISRLLSGHLLITIFGIQFLVTERGFSNKTAALVGIPFGVGYLIGTVGGGYLMSLIDRMVSVRGRVAYIQAAQVFFAVVAFFGTQIHYTGGIAVYCVFWALMGLGQGVNPPVNRPIVAAVILPELRGQGFAIWLTIFETIGWALFSLLAGNLAVAVGIQTVFLWVMVILMLVNAAILTILYLTYPRDVRRVDDELSRRRATAHAVA